MIPICLTMQAFGPYRNEEVVDFTKFYDSKLFLITGNTGSGKTMIFDGICYALFGEASGQDRRADTFRSQFSNNETLTYVKFDFFHRNRKYSITREPEQIKISKGKEVIHRSNAKIIFDDEIVTGVKNVNQIVKEILGIDYTQFKQIVMIAQGEFRKLVSADSREREHIYRKIFNTTNFESIQNSLKERFSELDKRISHLNEKIIGLLESIKLIREISYEDLGIEQILKILKDDILNYSNKYNDLICKEKDLSENIENKKLVLNKLKELDKLETQFKNMDIPKLEKESSYLSRVKKTFLISEKERNLHRLEESYSSFIKEISELKINLSECEESLKLYKTDLENMKFNNSQIEILKNKIIEIEILENCVDEKIVHEKRILDYRSKVKCNEMNRKSFIDKIAILENEKDKILKFEIENKDIAQKILKIEKKIDDLNLVKVNLSKYSDDLKLYEKTLLELEESGLLYDEISKLYKEKNLELMKSEEVYFKNQAGILAKSLKENSPCMVCGSTIHPNKALVPDDFVDEESLKRLKGEFLNIQTKREQISNRIISLKNQISFGENNLMDKYNQLKLADEDFNFVDFPIFKMEDSLFEKIDFLFNEFKFELNECEKINNRILQSKDIVLKIDNDIKMSNDSKNILDKDIDKMNVDISASELILKQNKDRLLKYNIHTKNDYIDILNRSKSEYKDLLTKSQAMNDNVRNYEDKIMKLKTQIDTKNNDISKLEADVMKNKEDFLNSINENGFSSIEDYINFKLPESEYNKRNQLLESKRDDYRFLKSSISNLKKEIGSNDSMEIENINNHLTELIQKLNEVGELERELSNKITLLKNVKDNIMSIDKNISELDKYRTNLNELSKISNGNNKYKISFERYILGIYFKEIIAAANIRFLKLTNGRYLFRHMKERFDLRVQQGLDVSVFDNYTSSERKINTLSGGESFKASLSLALGLSDVIQRHSGGISIDTLFIDEGFGSLDSDSLQNALDCLVDANSESKLIGIISHVQELKDFINSKIEVLDSVNGSRIKLNE